MLSYSTPISRLAKYLVRRLGKRSQDKSFELITSIALAYAAADELRGLGEQGDAVDEVLGDLERLYNKAVILRSRLPVEQLDLSLISRFGRAQIEGETKTFPDR